MSDPQVPAESEPTQNPTQPLPQFAAPVPPPLPQFAAPVPPPVPPTYAPVPVPPPQDPARGRRVALGVGAGLAGLLLLVAGIGIGRATAPKGPESLVDAVRMAHQGTLPCGSAAEGGVGGFIVRLCQQAPGQGGPGLPRGFGGNGGGNRNGNGGGGQFGNGGGGNGGGFGNGGGGNGDNGSGNNGSGNRTGQGSGA